jgi:hypothetical protein
VRGLLAAAAALIAAAGISYAIYSAVATSPSPYDRAIAYTKTRPPFTPIRTVEVASATAFKRAIANLRPGDLVEATDSFTVSGQTIIRKRLSSYAEVDLSRHTVRFVYPGTDNVPAVWVANASHLRIFGGDLSTPNKGGGCLRITGSQHVTWWGFVGHDCGGTGLSIFTLRPGDTGAGPVEHDDIQGEVRRFGQNSAWDPHREKCTGLHGANLADANYAPFDDNRIALYAHDSHCAGAGIEFGSSQSTNIPTNTTIYLRAAHLSFVSKIQTGGNCFQTWGYGVRSADIKYLECDDVTGHPYWAHGLYRSAGSSLSTDTVEYGRASNVRQNPRYAKDPDWDPAGGTSFKDVAPTAAR